jgi:hypothetical protein
MVESRIFSSRHPDQLWAHPDSYPMGTGGFSLGREADHSPPTSAEVKRIWVYTYISTYAFIA